MTSQRSHDADQKLGKNIVNESLPITAQASESKIFQPPKRPPTALNNLITPSISFNNSTKKDSILPRGDSISRRLRSVTRTRQMQ